jgi:hypothetical protein
MGKYQYKLKIFGLVKCEMHAMIKDKPTKEGKRTEKPVGSF